MAIRVKNPLQDFSIEPPVQQGVAFRGVPGNAEGHAFVWKGDKLIQIPKEQFGGNFMSLPQINPGHEAFDTLQRQGKLQNVQGSQLDFQNLTPLQQDITLGPKEGDVFDPSKLPVNQPQQPVVQPASIVPQASQQPQDSLGSAQRTNQLLQEASKKTGIPAQTFTNQPNQYAPIPQQQAPVVPQSPQSQQPQQPIDSSYIDQIKGLLGQFGLRPPSSNQSPQNAFADTYKQLVEQFGLDKTRKEYEDLVKKQTDEVASVNENPWLSEGARVRRVQAIEGKYQTRLSLLQSMYDRDQSNAHFIAQQALTLSHQNQLLQQEQMFKIIDLAEKEVAARRAESKETERIREFGIREEEAQRREDERIREFGAREAQQQRQFEERMSRAESEEKRHNKMMKDYNADLKSYNVDKHGTRQQFSYYLQRNYPELGGIEEDVMSKYPNELTPKSKKSGLLDYFNPFSYLNALTGK